MITRTPASAGIWQALGSLLQAFCRHLQQAFASHAFARTRSRTYYDNDDGCTYSTLRRISNLGTLIRPSPHTLLGGCIDLAFSPATIHYLLHMRSGVGAYSRTYGVMMGGWPECFGHRGRRGPEGGAPLAGGVDGCGWA